MTENSVPYEIYSDGACDPNPGKGGWGAVIIREGQSRQISGGENDSTNNRMELTAAIEALKSLPTGSRVKMYCDSEYVKKGITEWMPGWKKRGWKRSGGVLKNLELWQALDVQNSRHQIIWTWVHGHNGNIHNEEADRLAVMARKKL